MSTINLEILIGKCDVASKQALEAALNMVVSYEQSSAELSHWLYQLCLSRDAKLKRLLDTYHIGFSALEKSLLINIESIKKQAVSTPTISQHVIDVLSAGWQLASLEYNRPVLSVDFIFCALLSDTMLRQVALQMAPVLKKVDVDDLKLRLKKSELGEASQASAATNGQSALAQYTMDLVAQATAGNMDPVIGRELEMRQAIDILLRRRQNNPILTGEPGVGKTAVVEGLALRIAQKQVPASLADVRIHSLDLGLLQAGAGIKGEFERRLKSLIQEIENSQHPIILFVDEAHTLIGAGAMPGQTDAANLLKPALARGQLRVIAATTWSEYKKYIESDPALTRRFQVVAVKEPDEEAAIHMLRHIVEKLEQHHHVRIRSEAVDSAVRFSHRYLTERKLPDSAVSVLDTACARVSEQQSGLPVMIAQLNEREQNDRLELQQLQAEDQTPEIKKQIKQIQADIRSVNVDRVEYQAHYETERQLIADIQHLQAIEKRDPEKEKQLKRYKQQLKRQQAKQQFLNVSVDKHVIADVISNWTGIPKANMLRNAQQRLLSLEEKLKQRIVGQDQGIKRITSKLTAAGAKLLSPNKPIGVFLLVGPSGVGKTETAYGLAQELFGDRSKMTVINMSEFKEAHKISTLTGSPPGYVGYGQGGVLTEAIRRQPYSLILLDEMEKAHRSVQELFFQLFDKGELRDSEGRDVNCKNTLIVMTSNAASDFIEKATEDGHVDLEDPIFKNRLQAQLQQDFSPAFLGRTTIVPFLPLAHDQLTRLIHRELDQLQDRIYEQYQVTLQFDPEVDQSLLASCTEKSLGARQIGHSITQQLLPSISASLLEMVASKRQVKQLFVQKQGEQWTVT